MLDNNERFKLFYETAFQLQRREVELLFQRFNFFLIGTAFLITAFAAVVVSQNFTESPCNNLVLLAHAINAVGYYIAFFFTIANYLNTRTINKLGDYIRGLEDGNFPAPPHLSLELSVRQLRSKPLCLIIDMCKNFGSIFISPFDFSKHHPAPHTWLIPSGFVLFWIFAWLRILPSYQFQCAGISLPFVYIAILPFAYLVLVEILQLIKVPKLIDWLAKKLHIANLCD